jgi:hypothetical protein
MSPFSFLHFPFSFPVGGDGMLPGHNWRLTSKLSDRRSQRTSTEADDVVEPVTHKTETHSAGSLQRHCQAA